MAEIDDTTNCLVCYEAFRASGQHLPRIFPCFHTVCEKCVKQLIKDESLECPECRAKHGALEGVTSFPQNKYVIANIQYRIKVQKCESHDKALVLYCAEDACQKAICSSCMLESHRDHRFGDFEGFQKEKCKSVQDKVEELKSELQGKFEDFLWKKRKLFEETQKCIDKIEKKKKSFVKEFDDMVEEANKQMKETDQELTDNIVALTLQLNDLENLECDLPMSSLKQLKDAETTIAKMRVDKEEGLANKGKESATTQPEEGTKNQPEEGAKNQPEEGAKNQPEEGAKNQPEEGAKNQPEEGATSEGKEGVSSKPDDGALTKPKDGAKSEPLEDVGLQCAEYLGDDVTAEGACGTLTTIKVTSDGEERAPATSSIHYTYTVTDVSKLHAQKSPVFVLHSLPWSLLAKRVDKSSLGFFVQCNMHSESKTWTCKAKAEMAVLTYNDKDPFTRDIDHVFFHKENDWGYTSFLDWSELVDEDNGYYNKDEDTIRIEIKLEAEKPTWIDA